MADETKDKQEQISEDLLPLYDGVQRVTKFAVDTEKRLVQKLEDQDSRQAQAVSALEEKVEKGFGNVVDRIEILSKRSSFAHNPAFAQDDIASIKEAVPERFLKNMSGYELEASGQKGGLWSDPRGVAATHAWFALATRLQLRHFDNEREKNRVDFDKLMDRFRQVEKADMGGLVDTSGGYAVPNIVGNEVLKIIRDASQIYGRARQIQMTSDTLSFPDEATAVTINWSNTDGTTLTAGEPVFGVKTLNARKLIGRATFSLELLDDANVAIIPFLQSCFAEKMGGELDSQAMEGTGAPFTGVSGATSVGDCARTNGTNGVALTYGSAASTAGSLVQLFTKAGESYTRDQGIFVCGPGVYAKIIGLVDNNLQPVVRLGTVEGQPNNTLFGRPVVVSARMGVTTIGAGTNSVGGLYFGPPSALLFGTRQGFRWDVTDQVSWAKYSADARMVGRFGYVVGVPTAWAKQGGIITAP